MGENITFTTGIYLDDLWIAGMGDFLAWLNRQQRECIPKGPCGQDVLTTSGARGLTARYPTFADAYSKWASDMRQEAA